MLITKFYLSCLLHVIAGSFKVIERERDRSSCAKSKGHGDILRTVKAEPSDCRNSSQNTATVSCVVPNDDDFLV